MYLETYLLFNRGFCNLLGDMQGDAAIAIFLEILADLFVQKRIAIHSASESAESLPFVVSNKQKHLCVTIKKVRCYT